MDVNTFAVTLVITLVGNAAVFSFIQFLITRKDTRNDRLNALESTLKELKDTLSAEISRIESKIRDLHCDIDKTEAINARIRILAASDEIRHGQIHSSEFFDQLNEDITLYENYCREHADFKNNRSVHAIENINRTYQEALRKNNFL